MARGRAPKAAASERNEPQGPARKRPIEQYDHKDKKRPNNPPVGLVTPATDRETARKKYSYDPHLDPSLQWAGKAEHLSFEVPNPTWRTSCIASAPQPARREAAVGRVKTCTTVACLVDAESVGVSHSSALGRRR